MGEHVAFRKHPKNELLLLTLPCFFSPRACRAWPGMWKSFPERGVGDGARLLPRPWQSVGRLLGAHSPETPWGAVPAEAHVPGVCVDVCVCAVDTEQRAGRL